MEGVGAAVMLLLSVQIDRFVDEHPPGFVECSLVDANGTRHLFVEKVPVLASEDLWTDSAYPRPGAIACQIEAELKSAAGDALLRVSTELPWHVESTTGQTVFTVRAAQVRESTAQSPARPGQG